MFGFPPIASVSFDCAFGDGLEPRDDIVVDWSKPSIEPIF